MAARSFNVTHIVYDGFYVLMHFDTLNGAHRHSRDYTI
jgi:hypothetical protein